MKAVTPQITPEGSVILNVDVNKDSRGTLTPQGYAINTKHAQTQVLVAESEVARELVDLSLEAHEREAHALDLIVRAASNRRSRGTLISA